MLENMLEHVSKHRKCYFVLTETKLGEKFQIS